MNRILYIQASPRGVWSESVAIAKAFLNSYRIKNPKDSIDTLDVFTEPLPSFDGLAVQAKYTVLHYSKPTGDELTAWHGIEKVIERFKAADKYIMAVPMWNFGIPYRLKLLIDILVQPGYTFSFTETGGYKGLIVGKPLFVVYSRGGEYPAGSAAEAFDMQKKYVELIFGFMGFTDIRSVVFELALSADTEAVKRKRQAVIEQATKIAENF